MSSNATYDPDAAALAIAPWTTALLSQRDVSLQVPINFLTEPQISLTAACFQSGVYDTETAAKCLSNLLALGFRRYYIDIYWDGTRQEWSFCPVALPSSSSSSVSAATSSTAPVTSSVEGLSSAQMNTDVETETTSTATPSPSSTVGLRRVLRQEAPSGSSSGSPPTLSDSQPTASSTSTGEASASTSTNGQSFAAGHYSCSANMGISYFTNILSEYLTTTETTLSAHLITVVINLHASESSSSLGSPPETPSNLPSSSESVGTFFQGNLTAYLYTPSDLSSDRSNLNTSWYTVLAYEQPDPSYYITNVSSDDIHYTTDGWPSEGYIEFAHGRRLLLGWGSVDPQMEGYNFTDDESVIFPQGELDRNISIAVSDSEVLDRGCFFNTNTTDVSQVNSSWADSVTPSDAFSSFGLISNITADMTACGISPLYNATSLDFSGSSNITFFQNVSYSAIWSWAPGEPRNSSTDGDSSSNSLYRCAIIDPTLGGRWRVDDCSQRYYAACRNGTGPYDWEITSYSVSYSSASQACSSNTSFSVPRTGLENTYLYSAIRSRRDVMSGSKYVWIDFNSLDIEGCWVTGGVNATCPYYSADKATRERTVLVPTIAAVIVFVITALTLFVKCNENRRSSRRRKRAEGGWDYEGVPS